MCKSSKNSEMRELIRSSAPVAGESLFNTLMHAVDAKMVSALDISRIAAVSFSSSPRLFVYALFFSFNTSTNILLSERLGKNDRDGSHSLIKAGFIATALLSLIFGLICYFFATPIMSLFVKEADVLGDAADYFKIIMAFAVFPLLGMYMNACNIANKNTKSVLFSNIVSNAVNLIFDYLLIDGHLGFPAFGIKGAAYATVIGGFCGMLVSAYWLFASKKCFSIKDVFFAKLNLAENIERYVKVWKHLIVYDITNRAGMFILSIINSKAGVFSYSIYTVSLYYLNINFAVGNGLAVTLISFIARDRDDHEKISKYAAATKKILLVSSIVLGVLYPLTSVGLFRFYSGEAAFVEQGFFSALIIAVMTPLHITSITYAGVLNSMRETAFVSRTCALSILVVDCVTSYICVVLLGIGIYGIWLGSLLTYITNVSAFLIRLKKRQSDSAFRLIK